MSTNPLLAVLVMLVFTAGMASKRAFRRAFREYVAALEDLRKKLQEGLYKRTKV